MSREHQHTPPVGVDPGDPQRGQDDAARGEQAEQAYAANAHVPASGGAPLDREGRGDAPPRHARRRRSTAADAQPERPVRWVRTAGALAYLGVSRTTLWRLFEDGRLPEAARKKLGGVVWYDLDVFDDFLAHGDRNKPK